jgi:threonine aldolase
MVHPTDTQSSPLARGFGSDNHSGVHPEVLAALAASNEGHVPGYGEDPYTAAAEARFCELFGAGSEAFFVFGGTGANVLGLSAGLDSYQAVICARTAHIYEDECGAVEKFSGCKLLAVDTPDGKLTADLAAGELGGRGDVHQSQPRILSITQPTELGTLYSGAEIAALADFAHRRGMLLHMDGARICNAAAALDLPFRAFTRDVGVDILSFGGTKNGMMYGEAVLFFAPGLAERFSFFRKQGTQLPSKMRFIAAQFLALLEGDLWLRNARQANRMARRLADGVQGTAGVQVAHPVQANAVFALADPEVLKHLRECYFFYGEHGLARWMCSFDTCEEDVDAFVKCLEGLLREGQTASLTKP